MGYDIRRYFNIRGAHSAQFHSNGTLSFIMDTTGVPQIWRLTEPFEWPEQRTYHHQGVTFFDVSPDGSKIIFGQDRNGNERTQFYELDRHGQTTALTTAPDAIHRWGGFSNEGDRFAFTSNKRKESAFDVYVQKTTAADEGDRCIRRSDSWLSIGGWSPDDTYLSVIESHSASSQDIHIVNVETGKSKMITSEYSDIRYKNIRWGRDSNSLFLITDYDSDVLYIAKLEIDTGSFTPVITNESWNIHSFDIDPEAQTVAYSSNEEGYSHLTVADLRNTTEPQPILEPDIPRGVIQHVTFGRSGKLISLTVTAPGLNPTIYVINIETGDANRWTRASTAGIPREQFHRPQLIKYESFDGLSVPAFFTLPDEIEGQIPAIIDIHGGPASQHRPTFNPVTQYFAESGYAVLQPNIRGSTGYGSSYSRLDDIENRMDAVEDIYTAAKWLQEHEDIDRDSLLTMGGSYGGYMSLLCLTEYPDVWSAGITICGIINMITFLNNTGEWRKELREAEYGSLEEDFEFLQSISPINSVSHINAPVMVIHGENDPRVPITEAEQFVRRMESNDMPVHTMFFDDEGHGFSKKR